MKSLLINIPNSKIILWSECFGDENDSPLLLLAGAGQSGLYWPDRLCSTLANNGHFVIRFDYRDVGASSRIDYDEVPYTLEDLATDTLAVLDAYHIKKADIIGLSMGGYIAQILAARYPEYIRTMTLISTSPDHRPAMAAINGQDANVYELPSPLPEAFNAWKPKNTPQTSLESFLTTMQLYVRKKGFDEQEIIALKNRLDQHASHRESKTINHRKATMASNERTELLRTIKVPTLVIHGNQDIIFPIEHALATTKLIPHANLEIIPEMGHCISNYFIDQLYHILAKFLSA